MPENLLDDQIRLLFVLVLLLGMLKGFLVIGIPSDTQERLPFLLYWRKLCRASYGGTTAPNLE